MRLIDADELIERLKPYIDTYGEESFPYNIVQEAFIYEVEHEPTVDVMPVRRGKWIRMIFDRHLLHCDFCHKLVREPIGYRFNYCPNCGARMEE